MTAHSLEEVRALHRSVPVVDLHADTPLLMRRGYDFLARHQPFLPGGALFGHVDLPRMQHAGMTAQVFGLVTLPVVQQRRLAEVLRQVACVEDAVTRSGGALRLVAQAQEVRAAHRDGVQCALLSLEGVHAADTPRTRPGHASLLDALHALCARGVRSVGLVHFTGNAAGTPGMLGGSPERGLTRLGLDVVDALGDWGCLVDLAHLNPGGCRDVLARTRRPVVVTHTGLHAFSPIMRNIDDDVVRAVARTGGVIGIIYSRQFLGAAELDRVVQEFVHLVKVGGEDVAALGSDFDGFIIPSRGLADVTGLLELSARLWEALGERVLRKLLGENVLRVLEAVPLRAGRWQP